MTYLIVKSLHIVFMVTWMAGLFYLPRLFVYHAQADDRISIERFKVMERKLFWGITTPGGVLTIVFGLWLWLGWFQGAGLWLHAKLALVAAAGGLPRLVRQADAGFPARAQHAQPRLVPLVQRDSRR